MPSASLECLGDAFGFFWVNSGLPVPYFELLVAFLWGFFGCPGLSLAPLEFWLPRAPFGTPLGSHLLWDPSDCLGITLVLFGGPLRPALAILWMPLAALGDREWQSLYIYSIKNIFNTKLYSTFFRRLTSSRIVKNSELSS